MINVKKFIERKHWKLENLADRLFESGGTSRVGNWSTGVSSPRYEMILKLIELGITAEELLGKEHADLLIKNSLDISQIEKADPKEPIDYEDPKFLAYVEKAVKIIEERKKKAGELQ